MLSQNNTFVVYDNEERGDYKMDINDWIDSKDPSSKYYGMDDGDLREMDTEYRRRQYEEGKKCTAVEIHTVEQWETLHKKLGLGGAYPAGYLGLYSKLLNNPPIYQAVDKQCHEYEDCENIISFEEAIRKYNI